MIGPAGRRETWGLPSEHAGKMKMVDDDFITLFGDNFLQTCYISPHGHIFASIRFPTIIINILILLLLFSW
jgi:hypothetical protein